MVSTVFRCNFKKGLPPLSLAKGPWGMPGPGDLPAAETRLDVALVRAGLCASRVLAKDAVQAGLVTVDGVVPAPGTHATVDALDGG